MYYSGDERICVAMSDSPLGPFRQVEKKPMLDEKAIDHTLFIDDDGKAYLFFVRFNDGLNVWVAELEKDLVTLKEKHCITALKLPNLGRIRAEVLTRDLSLSSTRDATT